MSINSVPYTGYCENDVYISNVNTTGSGTVSAPVRIDAMAGMGPLTISNIYMDLSGAFYPFLGTGPAIQVTRSGNKNLVTGAPLTAGGTTYNPYATGVAWWTCS